MLFACMYPYSLPAFSVPPKGLHHCHSSELTVYPQLAGLTLSALMLHSSIEFGDRRDIPQKNETPVSGLAGVVSPQLRVVDYACGREDIWANAVAGMCFPLGFSAISGKSGTLPRR
jgi:hypothetical protein